MRTWKQNIPEAKFLRVKRNKQSKAVKREGYSTIIYVSKLQEILGNNRNYVLGDFLYSREYNPEAKLFDYYCYRVMPQEALTLDYGYYEHRLQQEEK